MLINQDLSYEEYGFGAKISDRKLAETAEKWIPRLQELDSQGTLQLDDYIFRIRELEDNEPYLDIMASGLWFFTKKYDGPIPQEFIEDIKGFLAPTREEDYGVQEGIRYDLDKLGIPT